MCSFICFPTLGTRNKTKIYIMTKVIHLQFYYFSLSLLQCTIRIFACGRINNESCVIYCRLQVGVSSAIIRADSRVCILNVSHKTIKKTRSKQFLPAARCPPCRNCSSIPYLSGFFTRFHRFFQQSVVVIANSLSFFAPVRNNRVNQLLSRQCFMRTIITT